MSYIEGAGGESSGIKEFGSKMIKLPEPDLKGIMTVEQALQNRKSTRRFKNQDLSVEQIGQILWSCQGVNRPERGFLTCPSAGAIFPLITIAATPSGVFKYNPFEHTVTQILQDDIRAGLASAVLGQQFVAQAPLTVILSAEIMKMVGRYGPRGTTYAHIEAGHAAQNIHLQATAIGLGSVPVGAFSEDMVSKLVRCGKDEIPLYIIPVGYPQ